MKSLGRLFETGSFFRIDKCPGTPGRQHPISIKSGEKCDMNYGVNAIIKRISLLSFSFEKVSRKYYFTSISILYSKLNRTVICIVWHKSG